LREKNEDKEKIYHVNMREKTVQKLLQNEGTNIIYLIIGRANHRESESWKRIIGRVNHGSVCNDHKLDILCVMIPAC